MNKPVSKTDGFFIPEIFRSSCRTCDWELAQSRELRCSYILRHFKNVTSYLPVNRASAYLTKIPSCPLVECFFVQRYKRDVFQRACWYLRISNLSVWVTGWTMYLDNPSPHAVPGKAKSSNNIGAGAAVQLAGHKQ